MSSPRSAPVRQRRLPGWLGSPGGLRTVRARWAGTIALALFALLIPPLAGLNEQMNPDASARFNIFLGTSALVLALWAVSYNLMLGYTGMVSFAHAAYYGVGAYTVAYLFKRYQVPALEGLVLAPLVAGLFGFVTGLVALRAVRLYFSLLTLAISQLLFSIAFSWCAIGCDNGYHGIVLPDQLTDYTTLYYFVGAIVVVCLLAMFAIVRSPFGAALAAIRENRLRASSIGLNVKRYELAIFTIAALFAGVAGGLFAVFQQEAYPEMLYWTSNAQPVVVALLGGTGTFLGPALGALIYTALDNTINKQFPYQFDIILGAIVLAVVLVVPGGFSALPRLLASLRARVRRSDDQEPEVVESAGRAISQIDVRKAVRAEAIEAAAAPRGETILRVESLSKAFGGLRAVNDVGKSTLFNLITGRLKPDRGRVVFDGRDVTGKPTHLIARAGIGRAFQITSIFPRLSVRQNLQYAMLAQRGDTRRPFGRADRRYRQEALELLDAVGLAAYADLPAGQLSHGDQRAIEIAISLALGSRLVLLDEPTAGMSPYETEKAMELVRQLASERGLTLLFCEHDMEVVFGSARTITVMHLGRVLTQGTPEEVRSNPEVQKVYLGELEEATA
jgi:ABC-type branched-subunit amino acid transport system ATPase component/ABC-type branched-subunit amino acid transport system permease subunit